MEKLRTYCPIRKHMKVKGLDIVKWRPTLVPRITFANPDGIELNTLDTPARSI